MKVMTALHIYLMSMMPLQLKPTSQWKPTISLSWSFPFATDPYAFCFPSLIAWLHRIQLEQWPWGSRVFLHKFLVTSLPDSGTHCMLLQSRIDREIPVQLHIKVAFFGLMRMSFQSLRCTHEFLINKDYTKWGKEETTLLHIDELIKDSYLLVFFWSRTILICIVRLWIPYCKVSWRFHAASNCCMHQHWPCCGIDTNLLALISPSLWYRKPLAATLFRLNCFVLRPPVTESATPD